jgi:hypothetical protein
MRAVQAACGMAASGCCGPAAGRGSRARRAERAGGSPPGPAMDARQGPTTAAGAQPEAALRFVLVEET